MARPYSPPARTHPPNPAAPTPPATHPEPSQASLTCAATADAYAPDPKKLEGGEGREVFAERKGLSIFKARAVVVAGALVVAGGGA